MRYTLFFVVAILLANVVSTIKPDYLSIHWAPWSWDPIMAVKEIPVPVPTVTVKNEFRMERITAYNAVPEQTDANPEFSSCGPTQSNQIAVSRDIFFDEHGRKHLCGVPAILVLDDGTVIESVVFDTMNARFANSADILMDDYHEALAFGVKTGYLYLATQ